MNKIRDMIVALARRHYLRRAFARQDLLEEAYRAVLPCRSAADIDAWAARWRDEVETELNGRQA